MGSADKAAQIRPQSMEDAQASVRFVPYYSGTVLHDEPDPTGDDGAASDLQTRFSRYGPAATAGHLVSLDLGAIPYSAP